MATRRDKPGSKGIDLQKAQYFGLPEFDMFPDQATRKAAVKTIERAMMPTTLRQLGGFFVAVFLAFVPAWVLIHYSMKWLTPTLPHRNTIAIGLSTIVYTIIVLWLIRSDMPRLLRKQLLKAGVPVCLHCGYDLRGLSLETSQACPECGRTFSRIVRNILKGRNQAS